MKQLFRRMQERRQQRRRRDNGTVAAVVHPVHHHTVQPLPPTSSSLDIVMEITTTTTPTLPHGMPTTVVIGPKKKSSSLQSTTTIKKKHSFGGGGWDDDATTVSRYTTDSRGHFAPLPPHDIDEAVLQVALSAMALATRPHKEKLKMQEQEEKKRKQNTTRTDREKNNNINNSQEHDDEDDASMSTEEEDDDVERIGREEEEEEENQNSTLAYHERQATLAVEQVNWPLAIFHYEHALLCLERQHQEQQQQQQPQHIGGGRCGQNAAITSLLLFGWNHETLGTISTILNNLAYAAQVVRYAHVDLIIRYYQAALTIKRHVYGKLHESTAKTLNNLGSTYYLNRQFHPAASYYEEARDILRLLPRRDMTHEIATIGSNLGDVHYCLHQYERASVEYRNSLRLRWNLYRDKSDGKITRLLEQIATTEQKWKIQERRKMDGRLDNGGHVVDGWDDDHSTVSSGRSRGSWNQEMEQLRTELSVDLEFLDALEHAVPIQMAKEKATLFRELRNMTTTPIHGGGGGHDDGPDAPPPAAVAAAPVFLRGNDASFIADPLSQRRRHVVSPDRSSCCQRNNNNNNNGNNIDHETLPNPTATTTAAMRGQHSFQAERESSSQVQHNQGGVDGEWTMVRPVQERESSSSSLLKDATTMRSQHCQHPQHDQHHPFADCVLKEEESAPLATLQGRRSGASLAYPIHPTPPTIVASERTIFVTSTATPTRAKAATAHRRPSSQQQHNSPSAATPSTTTTAKCSPRTLTQSERQAALTDVKTRLAQLRASRQPPTPSRSNKSNGTSAMVLV